MVPKTFSICLQYIWLSVKNIMVRLGGDEENPENVAFLKNNSEVSFTIVRLVIFLCVFVSGVAIGLVSSSNVGIQESMSFRSEQLLFKSNVGSLYDAALPLKCTTPSSDDKRDRLTMENFLHPMDLNHSMSDEELFWRASMVPKIELYPYKRVPKVAFMFLTRGPLPFMPLWERFFKGQEGMFSIYVHTAPEFVLSVSNESVFYGRQIPSQIAEWGMISLVDAERRLLANALLDFSNERFVLLSESCIPVYNFQTVYKYLTESAHSFVESYDNPEHDGRGRYNPEMAPDILLDQWRKGSAWFEVNRALAQEIISDFKYYNIFKRDCHLPCFCDEHYIPTYLNIHDPSPIANRTVTWVEWSEVGSAHPTSFVGENVTESAIQNIRNNGKSCLYNSNLTPICYLFARKFAPSTLEPLLNMSARVMGY